jgi:hypothetical protein
MRDETHEHTHDVARRPAGSDGDRRAMRPAGATVSIPPRPAGPAAVSADALRARLALLRPQPLRLRPEEK